MSVLDLVALLESQGWTGQVWHHKSGASLPPPVIVRKDADPKVWWARPEHTILNKVYLQCLASFQTVNSNTIEHFQRKSYYKRLMRPLKLKMDCDRGIELPTVEEKKQKEKKENKKKRRKKAGT